MSPRLSAVAAFLLYFCSALVLGECYPLSRYGMYATSGYDRGTALVFLADGQPVDDLRDYRAFADFDPDALRYPPHHPSSQEYLLDAARHQVATHSPDQPPDGPAVDLQIGFRLAEVGPEGLEIVEPFVLLDEGQAWPR